LYRRFEPRRSRQRSRFRFGAIAGRTRHRQPAQSPCRPVWERRFDHILARRRGRFGPAEYSRHDVMIRAFLLDAEPLAVKRLTRLLNATGRVEIIGAGTDPVEALPLIARDRPDVLFLDIQMPGMTGFELLSKIDPQPLIVFTTAWDQYALQAFEVNSVDYLLKPIEP